MVFALERPLITLKTLLLEDAEGTPRRQEGCWGHRSFTAVRQEHQKHLRNPQHQWHQDIKRGILQSTPCWTDAETEEGSVLKILSGVGLGFLFTNPEARQITADLLRSTANSIAPEKDGKTFHYRVKDAVVEKVMEEQ